MPASKPYRTTWKRPPPTSMNASARKSSRNEQLAAAVASPSRPSGMNSGREPLGLPAPGQQALELVGPGAARDHALEHVGQPGQGLDLVQLRGRHQARHDRPMAGPAIGAGEQTILAPEGHHGVILPMSGGRSWFTTA